MSSAGDAAKTRREIPESPRSVALQVASPGPPPSSSSPSSSCPSSSARSEGQAHHVGVPVAVVSGGGDIVELLIEVMALGPIDAPRGREGFAAGRGCASTTKGGGLWLPSGTTLDADVWNLNVSFELAEEDGTHESIPAARRKKGKSRAGDAVSRTSPPSVGHLRLGLPLSSPPPPARPLRFLPPRSRPKKYAQQGSSC